MGNINQAGLPQVSGVASNRWITNPKHLGIASALQSLLLCKTNVTAIFSAGSATFWTAFALRGAVASISVADTYVVVANISAAGFLTCLIAPTHTAAFTPTMRVTVDGTVYTLAPSAAQTLATRMVVGSIIPGYTVTHVATAAVAGDIVGPATAGSVGFNNTVIGGVYNSSNTATFTVPTPEEALWAGFPVVRFAKSLKVEMKCSLLSGTANDKQCGVAYRLDL